MASDIGPTLPRYMVAIIINLPMPPSDAVRFLVSPTVAAALTVSYIISSRLASHTRERSSVDINTIEKDMKTTVSALLIAAFVIWRLNIFVFD